MRKLIPLCRLIACGALLLGGPATGASQVWKKAPGALKKATRVPAVVNPRLPLATRTRIANTLHAAVRAAVEKNGARRNVPPVDPKIFQMWLSALNDKNVTATRQTRVSVSNLGRALDNYYMLSPKEQAQINLLIITLSQLRPKLGNANNGDFYKLLYPENLAENELPKSALFRIRLVRNGLLKYTSPVKKAARLPLQSMLLSGDYADKTKLAGVSFLQGFQPAQTKQELDQLLATLTPPGYTLRMGIHELGLNNQRKKFRQGDVHIHFEKQDFRAQTDAPVDLSIRFLLSVKPYVGIIYPKTRKVIVPFKDKKIAQNYLFLFDKYLTPQARKTLQYIADK